MGRLWLTARHEYLTAVRRRSFLLSTIGLPFFFAVILGLSLVGAAGTEEQRPAGYVDESGVLAGTEVAGLRRFADEASAREALDGGDIGAYFVLPPEYRETGAASLVYAGVPPDGSAQAALVAALRSALVADQPEAVRTRLTSGANLVVRTADGRRELSQRSILTFLVPLLAGMLFSFSTMNSAGYMVQAVATEKENRTIEVLTSTLTPFELVGGKAVGLMGVALTQLLIWLALAAVPAIAGVVFLNRTGNVAIPWSFAALAAAFFLPAYVMIAGLMTAIGSIVNEAHQGQQIAGTLNLVFVAPFFFIPLVFVNPNGPLMVAMTLFPTTAYLTVLMRWAVTAVPVWQLALSFAILCTSAALSAWAAARIFRASMLRYGQSVNLRNAWRSFLSPG